MHVCHSHFSLFADIDSDSRAKSEDDAWASVTQFYNSYQETVVRRLEQRQNDKRERRAAPEDDLRTSELSRPFRGKRSCIEGLGEAGEHDPHSHRWNELRHKVRSLFPPLSAVLICRARADGRSPCSFQHRHSNGQRRRNRFKPTF